MRSLRSLLIVLLGLVLAIALQAAGPLSGLPSQPGSHIAEIQALGDNEWLNLGSPAADPQWGKGRGRSWSSYMHYAQGLQGAFLGGHGVHGYTKPDGRYMDDTYFYDVNAHRWICIYPGTDSQTFVSKIQAGDLKMRDDGQLVDANGQPVPFCPFADGHSYQTHTYAENLGLYISVWGGSGMGGGQYVNNMQWCIDGKALLSAQMAGKTDQVAGMPFFYNIATGQFERHVFNLRTPCAGQGSNVVFYLPAKNRIMLYNHSGTKTTLLGDYETRQWSNASPQGAGPSGIDFGGCYDTKRHRVYLGASGYGPDSEKDKVFSYDANANAWSAHTTGQTFTTSNYGIVLYDSASDRVLNVYHGFSATVTVKALNPETMAWEQTLTAPASVANTHACWHAFYSPELNAHFIYQAGDSRDQGVMWAYRYKGGGSSVQADRPASKYPGINVQVRPNPFHSAVSIQLSALSGHEAGLAVYGVNGKLIKKLKADSRQLKAGFSWNASALPSGIYILKVRLGGQSITKRLFLQ